MGHSSVKTTERYIKGNISLIKGLKTPLEVIEMKK